VGRLELRGYPVIRRAQLGDVPALLGMAERFGQVAELPAPICPASMGSTFCNLIDNGILLTDGANCAAGAMVYPAFFNASYIMASEFFWWVDPAARGRLGLNLLDELEADAESRGARCLTMMTLEAVFPERTGRLFLRRGYRLQEHHYIKHF
jgi:hypothetical protein